MKARPFISATGLAGRWEWILVPYEANRRLHGAMVSGSWTYKRKSDAKRAALRWAKRLGLEIDGMRTFP